MINLLPYTAIYGYSSLQPETINVTKLRGDVLTVALRRLKARLLHCFERFFVESRAAALDDFRPGDFALRIDFDSERHIAFQSHAQSDRRVRGASGLNRFRLAVGANRRYPCWQTRRAGAAPEAGDGCAGAVSGVPGAGRDSDIAAALVHSGCATATFGCCALQS